MHKGRSADQVVLCADVTFRLVAVACCPQLQSVIVRSSSDFEPLKAEQLSVHLALKEDKKEQLQQ